MSMAETELGHYRKAAALLGEAAAIHSHHHSLTPVEHSDSVLAAARLLMATGSNEAAEKALREVSIEPPGTSKISYIWLEQSIGRAEASLACNRPHAAIVQAREVSNRISESGLGAYFKRWTAQAALLEGRGLLLVKRAPEALPILQRSVQLGSEVFDTSSSPALADSQVALAECLLTLGRRDEARTLAVKAQAIHATHQDLGEHFRAPLRALEARMRVR
jgi:tetratricopeptide (TPR) repeat protein